MLVLGLVLVASMVLSACAPKTTTPDVPDVTEAPGTTATEAPTEVAVPRTTRHGGWLDEVAMSLVTADAAVTQIEAGAIDLYASNLSTPQDLEAIRDAGLENSLQFGLFYEITYNPVGPVFEATGKLNPFASAKVREATNWLYDRNYMNQEIYGGVSLPKFLPLPGGFPDYARYVEYARAIEAKYAYDFDKADTVISEEMVAMGAEKVDGKWMFNGEQVSLIILIRTDSDGTRRPMGDYVANQFEALGFIVDRQYKTSSEASPLWIRGDPNDGLWHMYTGAWGVSGVSRSDSDNFQFYYTVQSAYSFSPLWQAYEEQTPAEFTVLSEALANNTFTTLAERATMMQQAMEMCNELAFRVWMIDGKAFSPWRPGVEVAYDLAAGIDINRLWPYTLRWTDQEGGLIKWGTPDLFVDPANPVAGSNWTYDSQWQNPTGDAPFFSNPYTGLPLPQRAERADVTVAEGLPVGATLDWVTLNFVADGSPVPADAWIDWDVENGQFITVGEKFPDGITALRKAVVYYPEDMFQTVFWQDGSPLSPADFVMAWIETFEVGMEGSAIYDETQASPLQSFLATFKGINFTSFDPLVVEYYSDTWYMDAEYNVPSIWPAYGYGDAAWHTITVSNLVEASQEAAYSADKSTALEVEWMNFIAGPTLAILDAKLDEAIAASLIPYPNVLGSLITADEAATRYANLKAFYGEYGHFWVGTGPYILSQVFSVEKTLTLKNNPNYVDLADKWAGFSTPKLSEPAIDGAGRVTIGSEATFDVYVDFQGEPYPLAELEGVKFLLFDATGELAEVGQATAVADGQFLVTLSAETTAKLTAGSCKLEVAVVSKMVAIPGFAQFEFVAE
jgi:peptide/nickel transport system substrate-binding protein